MEESLRFYAKFRVRDLLLDSLALQWVKITRTSTVENLVNKTAQKGFFSAHETLHGLGPFQNAKKYHTFARLYTAVLL